MPGLRGAAGEHAEPPLLRKPDDLAPDGRLADPRLALEREHGEPLARRIEKFPGERELTLAPDNAHHALSLVDSSPNVKVGPLDL